MHLSQVDDRLARVVHLDGVDRAGALAAGAAGDAFAFDEAGLAARFFQRFLGSVIDFPRRGAVMRQLSHARLHALQRIPTLRLQRQQILAQQLVDQQLGGPLRVVHAVADDLPLVPLRGEDPGSPRSGSP